MDVTHIPQELFSKQPLMLVAHQGTGENGGLPPRVYECGSWS
jgi:hypothetical protein